jgi:hypothetical protein
LRCPRLLLHLVPAPLLLHAVVTLRQTMAARRAR